jgi:hypothetical protein
MAGFAATGIHEYATGGIGASVFVSVTIELVYATLFAAQALCDTRNVKQSSSYAKVV